MLEEESPTAERVRTAEIIAALSLATDLSIGVPLERMFPNFLAALPRADKVHGDVDRTRSILDVPDR
jgi:hypothetical protein